MLVEAQGLGLDERRSVSGAGAGYRIEHRLGDLEHVLSVNDHRGYAETVGQRRNMLPGVHFHRSGKNAHAVVFAKEDHRQLPVLSHQQRLVGAALPIGSVTGAVHDYLTLVAALGGKAPADNRCEVVADEAGHHVDLVLREAEMKRRTPLAATGVLAGMLGEVVLHIDAFGEHVRDAVPAMVRRQVVILVQEGARSDSRGNGTLRRMVKADQFSLHHAPVHHAIEFIRANEVPKQR